MKYAVMGLTLLAVGVVGGVRADEEGTVQVRAEIPQRVAMHFSVTGYGILVPGAKALNSLSLPRAGQVQHWRVQVGQWVRRGDPLFDFVTDPLTTTGYEQARNAVVLAQSEEARLQRQFDQHLVTASQRDAARKSRQDAESAWNAQQQLGSGTLVSTVRAPYDGVVWSQNAAQGDRLATGVTVMQLASGSAFRVQLSLPPEEASAWTVGMAVSVSPLLGSGHDWSAVVDSVSGQMDAQTQAQTVWLALAPAPGQILGSRVRATLTAQVRSLWSVPRAAVLEDEKGHYVFQIQGRKAHRIDVSAFENDLVTGIDGPLNPALPVVVEGNYELEDGMAVQEKHR
ncbi:MAG: efflux RND transporter periplasmic adaptor subunit [Betaproteobacteria bacterium]|jgi:RND family efflux transporter, MFP subunit|nr:efflux RND transporter periplasmic adaptor subunit [Betaproteobacteria bacterium]